MPILKNLVLTLMLAFTLNAASANAANQCSGLFESQVTLKTSIPQSELTQVKPLNGVNGTATVFSATYQGKDVVIKLRESNPLKEIDMEFYKTQRASNLKDAKNEARWLLWFNALGVGAKFYGFTFIDGQIAIVVERVTEPNVVLKEPNESDPISDYRKEFAQKKIRVTKETIASLNKVIDLLLEHQVMGYDLQFLLTQSGKLVLIDTEGFKKYDEYDMYSPEQLAMTQARNFKRVLEAMMSNQ